MRGHSTDTPHLWQGTFAAKTGLAQTFATLGLARIVLHVGRSNFWSGTGAPRTVAP